MLPRARRCSRGSTTDGVEGYPPAPEPLPGPVLDSHAHLDISAAARDSGERDLRGPSVDDALAAARAAIEAKLG